MQSIAVAPDGSVWFGRFDKGVSRFDGQTWTTYTTHDGLASNLVEGIAATPDGALWFGTLGGVSRFDGQTWTTYTVDDGLADNSVISIAVTPDGALWFGTRDGGVSRFDGHTWTTYREDDGLAGNYVGSMAVAPDGALWFITYDRGVSRFDGEIGSAGGWTAYTPQNSGLPPGQVSAIAFARQGRVWFATYGSGMSMLDLSTGQPGCIPQVVADTWAIARVVGVLAAISLPFIWLGRRVAARGLMSRPAGIILLALASVLLLAAVGSALWSFVQDPSFLDVAAALLVVAIGLAICGAIGLRRRSALKEPQPLAAAAEADEARLGTLETDALVEMLRHSRDREERRKAVLELERRGMVEEM